jgi:D-ribose pyranose/furanose isomerase RbsD
MAKNRRRTRGRQLVTLVPKPVGVGFVVAVSLALVYLWMGHKCSQYSEEIKQLQNQCTELDNERDLESSKWNAMKTAEQLDSLLVRNGLLMVYPNAAQIVRVGGVSRAPALAGTDAARGATRVAGGHSGR